MPLNFVVEEVTSNNGVILKVYPIRVIAVLGSHWNGLTLGVNELVSPGWLLVNDLSVMENGASSAQ